MLAQRLPHWVEPWLFKDEEGDVIAFFNVEQAVDGAVSIQADLSGRHSGEAEKVVELLRHLQAQLGGRVTDDDDNIL